MSTFAALACTLIVVLVLMDMPAGWPMVACVLPGIWLLWLFDRPKAESTPPPEDEAPRDKVPGATGKAPPPAASGREVGTTPSPSAAPPPPVPKGAGIEVLTTTRETRTNPAPARARELTQVEWATHLHRHDGRPGWLYIARNDEFRDNVYKLGYTTDGPRQRCEALNDRHRGPGAIGHFRIVHAAEVRDAPAAENALFDALGGFRIAGGREFFEVPLELACQVVDSIKAAGRSGARTHVPQHAPIAAKKQPDGYAVPTAVRCPPGLKTAGAGFIHVVRNTWHRQDTYRLGWSRDGPALLLSRLNAAQKRKANTTHLGFFGIVHCAAVREVTAAYRRLLVELSPRRIDHRKPFLRMPLKDIVAAIDGHHCEPRQREARGEPGALSSPTITAVVVGTSLPAAHRPWAAWCLGCGAWLKFEGRIGEHGTIACPVCKSVIACEIGANGLRGLAGATGSPPAR